MLRLPMTVASRAAAVVSHTRGLRTMRARPVVRARAPAARPVAVAARDGRGGAAAAAPSASDDDDMGASVVPRAMDVSDGNWCEQPHVGRG
jgi:hypothetical protein